MNRQEFIAELRRAMSGSFSAAEIEDAAVYYEDYIDMQMKKGKSEAEVLRELGSPRLIAKSMKAAGGNSGRNTGAHRNAGMNAGGRYGGADGGAGGRAGNRRSAYEEDPAYHDSSHQGGMHTFRLPMWLILLVVLVLLLAILTIIFRVLFALLPIILVAAGIVTLYRYFSKK